MTTYQQGGCRCGAVRYEVDLTGAHTLACHCRDCQQHLGAPFSLFSVVPANQFRWINKPTGQIAFSNAAERLFCKTCGTYIKWEGRKSPHEAEINSMTLDKPQSVTVDEEIFTRTRLPWIEPIGGVPQYELGRNS